MTVRTRIRVDASRRVVLQLPDGVAPGEHDVTLIVDEPGTTGRAPLDVPVDDVGPWPDGLDLSREMLYGEDGR